MSKLIILNQLKTCMESSKSFAAGLVDSLKRNVLTKSNTSAYIPTADYNPATKKYVDDSTSPAEAHISENIASANGAHKLRYYNGKLQYNDNETWVTINISDLLI